MIELRALTVRQPWCEAIVDRHKPIENRSQGFPKRHRGPVLLHAAKGWSDRGRYDDRIRDAWHSRPGHPSPFARGHDEGRDYAIRHVPAYHGRPPRPFLAGVVLGIGELVDVHPAVGCCAPWGEETYPPANPEQRPPGRVTHLVFEDVHRLPRPIAARGALGLWRPDDDLELEVCHALAELITWDADAARALAERGDLAQLWSLVRDEAT